MSSPRPIPDRPGPGQESVWDYPRPPALDATAEHVVVRFGGAVVADTRAPIRVLETSHPPVYYLPRADVDTSLLVAVDHATFCEFKGLASYADLVVGERRSPLACWWYDAPTAGFEALVDHVTFYPQRVDACEVDGEVVRSVEGDFYGGWITSRVVGPFKGGPGTLGW
ncbi:DUF427 domain-containing protein [Nitriliruptoraceae bacterium ZYF776]|nr:DUF427 domain-containing protein [Profundirhabdus halotolerans]